MGQVASSCIKFPCSSLLTRFPSRSKRPIPGSSLPFLTLVRHHNCQIEWKQLLSLKGSTKMITEAFFTERQTQTRRWQGGFEMDSNRCSAGILFKPGCSVTFSSIKSFSALFLFVSSLWFNLSGGKRLDRYVMHHASPITNNSFIYHEHGSAHCARLSTRHTSLRRLMSQICCVAMIYTNHNTNISFLQIYL